MHTMMNTDQFYSSLKETKIANKTGFSSLTKCELQVNVVFEKGLKSAVIFIFLESF